MAKNSMGKNKFKAMRNGSMPKGEADEYRETFGEEFVDNNYDADNSTQNPNPQPTQTQPTNPQPQGNQWYNPMEAVREVRDWYKRKTLGGKQVIAGVAGGLASLGMVYLVSTRNDDREVRNETMDGQNLVYIKSDDEKIVRFSREGIDYEFIQEGNDGDTDIVNVRTKIRSYHFDEDDKGKNTTEGRGYNRAMNTGNHVIGRVDEFVRNKERNDLTGAFEKVDKMFDKK